MEINQKINDELTKKYIHGCMRIDYHSYIFTSKGMSKSVFTETLTMNN